MSLAMVVEQNLLLVEEYNQMLVDIGLLVLLVLKMDGMCKILEEI